MPIDLVNIGQVLPGQSMYHQVKMAMDTSDYVYGTIFVLYIALFLIIGGYICTRKRRRELSAEKDKSEVEEAKESSEQIEEDIDIQRKKPGSKKKD